MTRKLALLNLMLVALLGAAGWQIRERWREARVREEAALRRAATPPPNPAVPAMEPAKPVDALAYAEVAMKTMFSKDRNPTVVIEEAPKPPEEPVPTFPVVFGVMQLGGPITVFMSDGKTTEQKGYRPGDKVGAFELVSASKDEFTFKWKDKTFVKTLADLKQRPGQLIAAAAQAPEPVSSAPATPSTGHTLGGDEAAKKMQNIQKDMIKDGMIDTGATNRACVPGDSAPSGTIQAGYRKVMRPGLFGQMCYWEPAR
ncbi:MAG: hypothetical protein IT162_12220 [Bryobacterales bacterium]|nr:hypothetical protein [Bryobacterales bacterium]